MKVEKHEIIELERRLIAAISKSDIEFLDQILHDDLLFMAPNGKVITKAMDLASHRAGEMVVEKIESFIEDIKVVDDTAVVVVVYDTKGKMLRNPIQGRFRYIRVWKRCNEMLKVIGGSCFMLAEPGP